MLATPKDYSDWIGGLSEGGRAKLAAAGIDGPPPDDLAFLKRAEALWEEDGLPKYLRNGSPRVAEPINEEEAPMPSELRDDLAEGLRKVIFWILAGLGPKAILQRPQVVANRVAIVGRVLRLNGLDGVTLSDLAREAGLTRAAFSKLGVNFRDAMGSRFLVAPGDREHSRKSAKQSARRVWACRRKMSAGE